ncbi:MAG: outer membrane protein assembly factor BamA [Deltaproteobacteria bacterium]|nr:outer membrane protein assembly factor BamA [Deltaproteobacteria bacterium]
MKPSCLIRLYLSFLVFLILSFPGGVGAAEQIVDIDFQGLTSVSEAVVRNSLLSVEGTPYSGNIVKKDIKNLYKTGLFSDVSVQRVNSAGGSKLIFILVEKKVIGKLTVQGNKKIKGDDLAEAMHIHEQDLLDKAKIAETKAEIYKLYEKKGYHLVDIKTSIEPFDEAANQVELIFKIDENRPVKVRRIRFTGNKAFSDSKLRKQIKTKEKWTLSFLTGSGKLQPETLQSDMQMLRYFYLDNGYLKVKVGEPDVTLTRDKRSIYISIPVHEGQKYKVSGVSVAGDIITTEEELEKQLSLKTGQLYKKSVEIKDLQTLERIYGDQAYAFASIVPNITTDDSALTADVTYYIQKGPKVKIGQVIIKGNKVTRDKVIRRELKVIENSYYSQDHLEKSRMRLYQLGYFEDVNISTPRGIDDNTVDVVIEVTEKNTGTFSVGAGFSTLESFIFTATVQKENFLGRGISGGISANMSKLRQDIMISMSDRYFLDTKWYLGLSFERFQSQLNRDFDQNRLGGSVTFGRELFDYFHFHLGYRIAQVEVTNFSAQVPQFFVDNASGLTSAVSNTLTYDRRDNRISTKKGIYNTVSTEWSTKYLNATNNFLRVTSDNRVFFKLPFQFVLKGRGLAGYINSLDAKPVALFDRYFLGGINTLRGYELNTVGPVLQIPSSATGGDGTFTYGGNKMLLFNAELEIPIYAKAGFHAVTFFDSGNSYGEGENIDLSRLRSNYGFGLRWHSPLGPLRFEWGLPINKRADESGVVFNFSIGQSF